jgi:hypothetical protein
MGNNIGDFSVLSNGTPVEYIQNIVIDVSVTGGTQSITAIFPNVQVAPVMLQQAIATNVALLSIFPYVKIIYESAAAFTVGP